MAGGGTNLRLTIQTSVHFHNFAELYKLLGSVVSTNFLIGRCMSRVEKLLPLMFIVVVYGQTSVVGVIRIKKGQSIQECRRSVTFYGNSRCYDFGN